MNADHGQLPQGVAHPEAVAPKRRPRFRRAPPTAFRLTDGDVAMLVLLARHRFLRSTHIAALIGRSLDRTNDRLRKLFDGGLVDRPRAQLDFYPDAGSAPMVYALAEDGARLLARQEGASAASQRRSKNGDVGRQFIDHQLAIADFIVAVELSVRCRSDLRLISQRELAVEIKARGQTGHPFKLSTRQEGAGEINSVVPDLAFGLGYKDGSRRCFLVEIDRGTMPIIRNNARQSSLGRKLRTYQAAFAEGLHERQLGWKSFRVLTVTTSTQRLASALSAANYIVGGSALPAHLLLFAVMEDVRLKDPISEAFVDRFKRSQRLA